MSGWTEQRLAARRRIYLLRHAEVSYFAADGSPCDPLAVPLSDRGRRQADELAGAFAAVPLDRAVASGLPRTRETAAAIVGARGLAVADSPELREIHAGPVTTWIPPTADAGTTVEKCFVDALTAVTDPDDRFLGGETFGEFQGRVVPAFETLIAEPGWKTLLLVAHGGTNRVLLAHALGSPLTRVGRIEQDPACVNVIDVDADGRLLVRLMNHTTYSPLKEGLLGTTMETIFLENRSAIEALAGDALDPRD